MFFIWQYNQDSCRLDLIWYFIPYHCHFFPTHCPSPSLWHSHQKKITFNYQNTKALDEKLISMKSEITGMKKSLEDLTSTTEVVYLDPCWIFPTVALVFFLPMHIPPVIRQMTSSHKHMNWQLLLIVFCDPLDFIDFLI